MENSQLKNKIIQRIIEIDDPQLLISLNRLLNGSDSEISRFLTLAHEKLNEIENNETEDFTKYIKEWVKNM